LPTTLSRFPAIIGKASRATLRAQHRYRFQGRSAVVPQEAAATPTSIRLAGKNFQQSQALPTISRILTGNIKAA